LTHLWQQEMRPLRRICVLAHGLNDFILLFRTNLFFKEQKQYSHVVFVLVLIILLVLGAWTWVPSQQVSHLKLCSHLVPVGLVYVWLWLCFALNCDNLQGCHVIYQTRERVFYQDIQTPRSGFKKRGATADFFLTDFEVFGYLMKHSFSCLIWLLRQFVILGEIQSKSSQNFMLI